MGKRGPAKKPTKLKILEGNPGKKRLPNEPQPTVGTLRKPEWLRPAAAEHWDRLAPELQRLGLLTVVDEASFGQLCQEYAVWREAEERLAAEEPRVMCVGEQGYMQTSPWETIRRNARADYIAIAKQFGMTPASRADVTTAEVAKADPFAARLEKKLAR